MGPGRELDALIAEKVMGHRVDFEPEKIDNLFMVLDSKMPPIEIKDIKPVPHYSTKIEADWEIVEKLGDDNFSLEKHGTHWEVRFGTAWAVALTAPLAICMAAIRAVDANNKFDLEQRHKGIVVTEVER
jgi:hypothetical protein